MICLHLAPRAAEPVSPLYSPAKDNEDELALCLVIGKGYVVQMPPDCTALYCDVYCGGGGGPQWETQTQLPRLMSRF